MAYITLISTIFLILQTSICLASTAPSASCATDGSCTSVQGICVPDELEECYPQSGLVKTPYLSHTPLGPEIESSNTTEFPALSDITLFNLTVQYFHIDPTYLTVCAYWDHFGHRGGYRAEMGDQFDSYYQVLLADHTKPSLCINYMGYFQLDVYTHVIRIGPHPPPCCDQESCPQQLSRSLHSDLRGCADIPNNDYRCTRRYGRVRDLTVTSSKAGTCKDLHISWEHQRYVSPPDAYYVRLTDSKKEHFDFKVLNSTRIAVPHLNQSEHYTARVQAYKRCSGLGKYTFDPHSVGCGIGKRVAEGMDEKHYF